MTTGRSCTPACAWQVSCKRTGYWEGTVTAVMLELMTDWRPPFFFFFSSGTCVLPLGCCRRRMPGLLAKLDIVVPELGSLEDLWRADGQHILEILWSVEAKWFPPGRKIIKSWHLCSACLKKHAMLSLEISYSCFIPFETLPSSETTAF